MQFPALDPVKIVNLAGHCITGKRYISNSIKREDPERGFSFLYITVLYNYSSAAGKSEQIKNKYKKYIKTLDKSIILWYNILVK